MAGDELQDVRLPPPGNVKVVDIRDGFSDTPCLAYGVNEL